MSCRRLVFDTGPLNSFTVVSQLDLLDAVCAGHGTWPLSVQRELGAGVRFKPTLAAMLQAIFLARRRGGVVVSEDRDARVLAATELGAGHAIGTPYLLRRAVRMRLVGPDEAWEIYRGMVAAGRHLERVDREVFKA